MWLVLAIASPVRSDDSAESSAAQAGAPLSSEYSVKAAFLFNFARYVKWPKSVLGEKNAPLIVAVLGKNPFDRILEDAFKGKRVGERELVVKYFETLDSMKDCHMLYVPQGEESGLDQVRAKYLDRPVLLVSESIAAAQRGAQIGFYIENSKVRFAINETAAKLARLEVSSELLKLAKIVKAEAPELE